MLFFFLPGKKDWGTLLLCSWTLIQLSGKRLLRGLEAKGPLLIPLQGCLLF